MPKTTEEEKREARLARIKMLIDCLPDDDEEFDEGGWNRLSEWEQKFLSSVREYWDKHQDLTINQEIVLERIWDSLNDKES